VSNTRRTIHHPSKETAIDTVTVLFFLLQKMAGAARALEAFQDNLEDYLLSQDAGFLARMRQARVHHLEGETRPLDWAQREEDPQDARWLALHTLWRYNLSRGWHGPANRGPAPLGKSWQRIAAS